MSSKKSLFHFLSSQNHSAKSAGAESVSRRMRKSGLEALEPRQMLSAVSFTADDLVEDNQFQAVLGNRLDSEDTSDRCVILNIAAADGSGFRVEDLTIRDANDEEVEILASKVENGVASILAKYTLGEMYTFEIAAENEDAAFNVHFTMAGDAGGDGIFTREEYYTLLGEVHKGNGVHNRFVSTYWNVYGVDISRNNYDAVYDTDGSGKITRHVFDTVIAPNYLDPLELTQEVLTIPTIEDFQVNGKTPAQVEDQKFSFVTNESKDLILSGKTKAQDGIFTWTKEDGTVYSGQMDLTKDGTFTLKNQAKDAAETDVVKLTYVIQKDGSFTISFPKDSVCDGTLTMELWNDPEHTMDSNTYSLSIDIVLPQAVVDDAVVKNAVNADDKEAESAVVKTEEVTLTVSASAAEGTAADTLLDALNDPKDGLYVTVYDAEGKQIARKRLEKSQISEKDGKVLIADTELSFKLADGTHKLTVFLTDLAGNAVEGTGAELSVIVDTTAPKVEVDGYKPDFKYQSKDAFDSMLVKDEKLTLTVKAEDANLQSVVCTQDGKTVSPAKEGTYAYDFELKPGINTIVFTVMDAAGNVTKQECLVYFSEKLELSEEGKTLQKEGLTLKYSEGGELRALELYDYFTYDSGLTFSSMTSNKELLTASVGKNGLLTFDFKQTPKEGETLSAKVTVAALNALGEICTLSFTVNYVRSSLTLTVPDYVLDFKYDADAKDFDSMRVEDEELTLTVKVTNGDKKEEAPEKDPETNPFKVESTLNGEPVPQAGSENGEEFTYEFQLKPGINKIVFTVTDSEGLKLTKTCWVYCDIPVALTPEGEELQQNGFVQEWSEKAEDYETVDLSKMFTHGNDLEFKAVSSDSKVADIAIDAKGILSFKYDTVPEDGQSLTADVEIEAEDRAGNKVTLKFRLTHRRNAAVISDVTVTGDYAEKSLADVEHIIAKDTLEMKGKLTAADGKAAILNILRNGEPAFADIDLMKSGTYGELTYVYDAENGTFTLTISGAADGLYVFSMTESKDGQNGSSEDGSEDGAAGDPENGTQTVPQEIRVVVDTVKPGVSAKIEVSQWSSGKPEVSVQTEGELNEQDTEYGAWVEIFIRNSEGLSELYARGEIDPQTGMAGELTYVDKKLPDGTYTLAVRTIDAAGNITEAEGNETEIRVDSAAPVISNVDGYTLNHRVGESEGFNSMLAENKTLVLVPEITEENIAEIVCTQNGKEIARTQKEDGSEVWEFALEDGLNEIVFTVTDLAGNSASFTCLVVWENPPVLTEAGILLQKYGLLLDVSAEEQKTLDLSELFSHTDELIYEADCPEEAKEWLKLSITDGILYFEFLKKPGADEYFQTEITLTARTAKNPSTELEFQFTCMTDCDAPRWHIDAVEGSISVPEDGDAANGAFNYLLNSDTISIKGKLEDASEIVSAELTILRDGQVYWSELDLLENASEELPFTYRWNAQTQEFEFCLENAEDGNYVFCIAGSDILGNTSTMENGRQEICIAVRTAAPELGATAAVIPTGDSETVVSGNPRFAVTPSGTPSEMDAQYGIYVQIFLQESLETDAGSETETLYAQAKYDAGSGTFGTLSYFLTETLADGEHTFRIQTVDAAGNILELEENLVSVTVDSTAPQLETENLNYASSDFGTYAMSDAYEPDSLYLTMEDLNEDGTYSLWVNASDDSEVRFEISVIHETQGRTSSGISTTDIPLEYGKNIVKIQAVDAAGNSMKEPLSLMVFLNDFPEISDAGWELETDGLTQLVGSGTVKKLNLNDYFSDQKQLRFSVENFDEENGEISVSQSGTYGENLTVTFKKRPTEDDWYFAAFIEVTATDEFGETEYFSFEAVYTYDDEAPVWKNVNVEGSGYSSGMFVSNGNSLTITGQIYDLSGISDAECDIVQNAGTNGEKTILSELEVLENSSGAGTNGFSYSYTYAKNADGTGGRFTLTLTKTDGSPIDEGLYSFYLAGKDKKGNDSTDDGELPEDFFDVLVDRTKPELSASMTLKQTGTSSSCVNKNPEFEIAISGTPSKYGDTVQILRLVTDGDGNTSEILYASGIIDPKTGTCSLRYPSAKLAEGEHRFVIQTVDIAGNVNRTPGELTVSIDLTVPKIIALSPQNTFVHEGRFFCLEKDFRLEVLSANAEENDRLFYSSKNDPKEAVLYDETAGIPLEYGMNALYFWLIDEAGNVSATSGSTLLNVICDSRPVLAEDAEPLADQKAAFDAENRTFAITLSKEQLLAMVADADIAGNGDALAIAFQFAQAEEFAPGTIQVKAAEDESGENYVLTFLCTDLKGIEGQTVLGTISVVVRDKWGLTPADEEGVLSFSIFQTAAPVEVISDRISVTQNETGTYELDTNCIFKAGANETWKVTDFAVFVGETQEENVSLEENGHVLRWTPSAGKYGNFTLKVSAAKIGADGTVIPDTETEYLTIAGLIEWAGFTLTPAENAKIELSEGAETFIAALSDYFTLGNAFDPVQAFGGYLVTDAEQPSFTVEVLEKEIFGWTLNEDGSRREHCTALFAEAPAVRDGNLTFTPAPFAYGSAELTLKAVWTQAGTERTAELAIPLAVANVPSVPFAAAQEAKLSVSQQYVTVELLNGVNSGADEDPAEDADVLKVGELTVKSQEIAGFTVEIVSENISAPDGADGETGESSGNETQTSVRKYLVLRDAEGRQFRFEIFEGQVVISGGEPTVPGSVSIVMDRILDADGNVLSDTQPTLWNLLDGKTAELLYTIRNSETQLESTPAALTLTFQGAPFDLTVSGSRSANEQTFESDLCAVQNLDPNVWTIESVISAEESSSGENVTWEDGKFTVKAGWFGTAVMTCTMKDSRTGELRESRITLTISNADLPPVWASGIETTDGKYIWREGVNSEAGTYSAELNDWIRDVNGGTLQFSIVSAPGEGKTEIDANGILKFTANDPDLVTDGVLIQVRATADSVDGTQTAENVFSILLVIREDLDHPEFTSVEFASGNAGFNVFDAKTVWFTVETVQYGEKEWFVQVDALDETGSVLDTMRAKVLSGAPPVSVALENAEGTQITADPETGKFALPLEIGSAADLTLKVTNAEGASASQTVQIRNAVSVSFSDESLKAYRETEISGEITSDVQVAQSAADVQVLPEADSVLTAGTVLKEGTILSWDVLKDARLDEDGPEVEIADEEDTYRLVSDVTLTRNVTLDADCSNVVLSAVGADSRLTAGSVIEGDGKLAVWASNMEQVKALYEAYQTAGTLLSQNVELPIPEGETVSKITLTQPSETHAVREIVWTENEPKCTVKYVPYQVTQDRSPIWMSVEMESGKTFLYALRLECEKPFEIQYTLTKKKISGDEKDTLPTSETQIDAEGGTYFLTAWLKCTLPTYAQEFMNDYAHADLTGNFIFTLDSAAVSNVIVGQMDSVSSSGNLWNVGCTLLNSSLFGNAELLADGTFGKLFQIELTATGTAPVEVEFASSMVELGFPFTDDESTGLNIGVEPESVSASQIWGTSELIYPVKTAADAVLLATASIETVSAIENTSVKTAGLDLSGVSAFSVTVDAAAFRAAELSASAGASLTAGIALTEEEIRNFEARQLPVEAWLDESADAALCFTVAVSETQDEAVLLRALESSSAIQKAAQELLDTAFGGELSEN